MKNIINYINESNEYLPKIKELFKENETIAKKFHYINKNYLDDYSSILEDNGYKYVNSKIKDVKYYGAKTKYIKFKHPLYGYGFIFATEGKLNEKREFVYKSVIICRGKKYEDMYNEK